MWRCSDLEKLESQSYSIMITDPDGVIEYVNSIFEELTGYAHDEVVGKNASILKSGQHDAAFYRRLWDTIRRGEPFREIFINRCKNGLVYCEEKTISPIRDAGGNITQFVSVSRGIPHQRDEHQRLATLAYYDNLTGLPNRLLFQDRLQGAMARARRTNTLIAVVFLDLDKFKPINDAYGHAIGDKLLVTAGQRLKSCLRDSDTVARVAGDEFMAILESIADSDQAGAVAQKIVDSFREPFPLEEQEVYCTCSLGIAVFPLDLATADDIVRHADMAMYHAKQQGRDNYMFYSDEMNERATLTRHLKESLRQASDQNGFFLCYQPLVDAATGRMTAVEALIRWRQPAAGLESPREFFPMLESTGLGQRVGEWVLRSACQHATGWRAANLPRLKVTVNVSTRQFWHKDFADACVRVLDETGLEPELLCLDVAEEILAADLPRSGEILHRLKDRGLCLCVDAFAKSHSNFSYLRHAPVDFVKIHRPYVERLPDGDDERRIIAGIIALAHHLDIKVVAIGVATREQMTFLLDHCCDLMQGYYFSKPLPEEMSGLFGQAGWRNRNFLAVAPS